MIFYCTRLARLLLLLTLAG
ncbi:hypothetical protein APX70_08335, partial [Pseudomonas syringae pv. maculicola]